MFIVRRELKQGSQTHNTMQYDVLVTGLQKHGRLCITMSVNIWDNSYEEKARLHRCDLSARLKAG